MESFLSKNNIIFLYALLALVYIAGLFIPLMEFDSAQHATMAMRMYLKNDFIHLFRGFDEYLDKPHMHFWLSAFSFKLFGVSHWAYRIPALLFTLLGAYSCYSLAKELYQNKSGHLAALIFLSSQAIILSNHDVRTDAVLTGASIFAIWQLVKYINTKNLLSIILGAIGLGVAFSTKGQLAVLIIGSALFCYVLYNRKWDAVFNWKLVIGLLTFLISSTPMLYAYYLQFDMHPEKLVGGQKNISAIRFIFWDQSFNRLSGTGFKSNNTDYFFFFHTLLWAFLPWAILTYIAIFEKTKEFFKLKFKFKKGLEFLTIGGFWLVMIIINISKSKLPHYMNSLLPILAVLLAGYLVYLHNNGSFKRLKQLLNIQIVIVLLGSIGAILLFTIVFPASVGLIISYIILFGIMIYYMLKKSNTIAKIITVSVLFSVFVNFSLNTQFYPNLLKYQGGSNMVKVIERENINKEDVFILDKNYSWSLNFYTERETPGLAIKDLHKNQGKWLFVYERDLKKLKNQNVKWDISHEVPRFRITRLSFSFLNPSTRSDNLSKVYLLHLL